MKTENVSCSSIVLTIKKHDFLLFFFSIFWDKVFKHIVRLVENHFCINVIFRLVLKSRTSTWLHSGKVYKVVRYHEAILLRGTSISFRSVKSQTFNDLACRDSYNELKTM